MNVYTAGDLVTLTAAFTNAAGAAANPTSVVFSVRRPDGTVLTPAPANPSTGTFTATQDTTGFPGQWRWKAVGTGAVQTASKPTQGIFDVKPQSF